MHIHDGLLDVKTCAATGVVSLAAVGWALRRARDLPERRAPLMGVVAACLFAAQMMNFPIPGGTSGHLMGGVLAAVMLGPWSGLLVITVVLAIQAVLFQDGGVTALGANVLNVGVLGSVVGYAVFEPLRRLVGGARGTVFGAVVAAWFSVILGAAACSVQLAASGRFNLGPTLGIMLLIHAMIALGESIITGLALGFVLRTRPDLVYGQSGASGVIGRSGQWIVLGLAMALVIAVFLSPFASALPDGLERSVERLGGEEGVSEPVFPSPMPDYAPRGWEGVRIAGSVAGGLGALVTFVAAFLLARGLSSETTITSTRHAS